MSMENKNSDKPATSQDRKLNGKIKYARKVNWSPTDKPETFRTVVVNYHFGNVEEVQRNTGAIPKSRESWNQALNAAAADNKKTDECSDVPSLGKLFQVSKEALVEEHRSPVTESFVPKELMAHGETEMCYMRSANNVEPQFISCSVRTQKPNVVKESKQMPCCEKICCMRPTKPKMNNPHEEKTKNNSGVSVGATEPLKPPVIQLTPAENENAQVTPDRPRTNPERSRNPDVCHPKAKAPRPKSKDVEIRCLPYPFGIGVVTHPDLCCCFCSKKMDSYNDNSDIYPLSKAMREAYADPVTKPTGISEDDAETAETVDTTEEQTEIEEKAYNVSQQTGTNDTDQNDAESNNKVHQASNIKLITELLKNRIQSSLATTARNAAATAAASASSAPPQQKNKPKPPAGTSNFKQRQMELHRYRIEVEERRLLLLDTKLRREMDEMMREKMLFTKELELKEAQIQQFKDERDLA